MPAESHASPGRPRVVILGAGFGGLFAAKALARAPVEVTIVDRHNYHLFQPLLYQVAVASITPSDIAWPIRSIVRKQKNATVLMDEVTGIDSDRRLAGPASEPQRSCGQGAARSWR
jgi:NADH dehydrogenase